MTQMTETEHAEMVVSFRSYLIAQGLNPTALDISVGNRWYTSKEEAVLGAKVEVMNGGNND